MVQYHLGVIEDSNRMDNMRQLIAHWQWQSGFKMLCKQIFLFIIGNPKKIRLKCTIKIPGTKRICCPL